MRQGSSTNQQVRGVRRRPYSVRPAALLVVLLAGAIGLFGARVVQSDSNISPPAPPATTEVAIAVSPTGDTLAQIAMIAPTDIPSPTLVPPTVTPTTTAPPLPTATAAPVSTQRPVPPPTGLDTASYIYGRGESGRKEVAFTFDAGEGPGHTAQILDILDAHGIKGSFGVTGKWAEENPDLLKRMVKEGHMVINHTYDHRDWTGKSVGTDPLTTAERLDEVNKTRQIILDITGYNTQPFFRFPYNDYDAAALETLKSEGYDYTLYWTCDTQAWNGSKASEIDQMCSPDDPDHGGPGAVILMHVVQDEDLAALPALIEAYQAEGYQIVTMEQMVQP